MSLAWLKIFVLHSWSCARARGVSPHRWILLSTALINFDEPLSLALAYDLKHVIVAQRAAQLHTVTAISHFFNCLRELVHPVID
ncbi:hypothetical protein BD769DRAFT_649473 [Suillus cothurnatus]|nr:hypothetical protein BD769DRAFT_649473 [Suillus cothurnatus]